MVAIIALMQHLPSRSRSRGKLVFFVPRWLEDAMSPSGLPYRVIPVLSSLTANGFDVDFFTEIHDGWQSPQLASSIADCVAAVAWCAELNPGVQVPSLLGFLERVRELAPEVRRSAGGGFFPLAPPPKLDLAPLTDTIVCGQEVDALSRCLLDEPQRDQREAFDVGVMRQLDLRPFFRPESMLFGNDEPTLQIPTGSGCGKRCGFCFYEQTNWRALAAKEVVDLIGHVHANYGVSQFLLGELDFLASRSRAVDIMRGLVAANLPVKWFALGSVQDLLALSDDEFSTMARSGCVTFELGIEAGGNDALRKLGKKFTVREAIAAHQRLLRAGILPVYNFVFGWPGETRQDQRATRSLIRLLGRQRQKVRFNFRLYQAIPGTTMGEQALQFLPELPSNLDELRAYRVDSERSLPWLSVAAERRVRFLTEYVLPLGYDDAMGGAAPDWKRRMLRQLARWRSRTGFLRLPVDQRVFHETAAVGLPSTYLP